MRLVEAVRLAEIVPLGRTDCQAAQLAVALIAAGEPNGARRGREHVAECLRCQAEVVAYRRMRRVMRSMSDLQMVPPPGAVLEAVATVHSAAGSRPASAVVAGRGAVRAATVGGITTASVAGVLVWLGRRRTALVRAS